MKLFNDGEREYMGPSGRSETWYSFLDRSARPECQSVRETLEQWFDIFPESETGHKKRELQRTFCNTKDDRQVMSAFFELYCHALLYHQGFVCETHLRTDVSNYDFFVRKSGGPVFCMECTTVSGMSDEEYNVKKNIDFIYDELDKRLKSPNFFLDASVFQEGSQTPAVSGMAPALEDWLESLDPDQASTDAAETNEKAGWLVSHPSRYEKEFRDENGWILSFIVIPKKKEARGKPGLRPIGMESRGAKWVRTTDRLLKRLEEKARKYGPYEIPYIIAVDIIDIYADGQDVENALAGTEGIHDLNSSGIYELTEVRLKNFWFDTKGARKKQVSAVLTAVGLFPSGIASTDPILWFNPWAGYKMDPSLWQGHKMILTPEDSETEPLKIDFIEEKNAWEILARKNHMKREGFTPCIA